MKKIIFISLLLIHTSFRVPPGKLKFTVRGLNIDTSNFKSNVFEKMDLEILIEMKYTGSKSITVKSKNFHFNILKNKVIEMKPGIDCSAFYIYDNKDRTSIKLEPGGKLFLTTGISCYQFHYLNQNYFYLNNEQKLKYLKKFINKLTIYYGDERIDFKNKDLNYSYKSIYYPFDPDKPSPLDNIIIVK